MTVHIHDERAIILRTRWLLFERHGSITTAGDTLEGPAARALAAALRLGACSCTVTAGCTAHVAAPFCTVWRGNRTSAEPVR